MIFTIVYITFGVLTFFAAFYLDIKWAQSQYDYTFKPFTYLLMGAAWPGVWLFALIITIIDFCERVSLNRSVSKWVYNLFRKDE